MKKQFLKTVSVIMALIMLCTAVPFTAFAATETHNHPGYSWTTWDGKKTLYGGYYCLEDDIVLSTKVIIYGNTTVYLCLNGHSITCEDTAFSIYSSGSLSIFDCKGTGKIETTSNKNTIINNGHLSIEDGTISNTSTGSAIYTCANAYTYVHGGSIESLEGTGLYKDVTSHIGVYGGEVHGGSEAIGGHGKDSADLGSLVINGGTITSDSTYSCINLANGNLTINDGIINGNVYLHDSTGTTTISGGTINGILDLSSKKITITGGEINAEYISFYGDTKISGGKFRYTYNSIYYPTGCMLYGSDNVISGGDFTGCESVTIAGKTSVTGGTFNNIYVYDNSLHLSSSPVIESLTITKPNSVSAVNPNILINYTGTPIEMHIASDLEDGDVLVENVLSDDVADRFFLNENETKWKYTEFTNNNIVLNVLPNGQCGDDAYWGITNGTLTIYGTGALWTYSSGNNYPWGDYNDEITKIVVEDGITSIPEYAFEYCENARIITLPETLTSLALNAFNDCGSLNNLLLPSSLNIVTGAADKLGFIRCESLTDVYYLGTVDEWYSMTGGKSLVSYNSSVTVNYLKFHESTRTCTNSGTDAYYRFDNTSVYRNYYDADKNVISIYTKPALGHNMGSWITTDATCDADGFARRDCNRCNYFESYTTETAKGHSYTSAIIAPTCTEQGYTIYICECGESYVDDYTDMIDHIDTDGDSICDICYSELDNTNDCSHLCHKTGFVDFFWKIIRFLCKIFGTNKVCECGAAHY